MSRADGIFRFEAFDSGGSPIHIVAEVRSANCLVFVDKHSGGRVGGCEKCVSVVEALVIADPFSNAR
jgi:hypothetical protein